MWYALDTEFNSFGGDLISLALVREDGESLYLVYPLLPIYNQWVSRHVIPHLYKVPQDVGINVSNWSNQRNPLVKLGPEERHMPTTAQYLEQFFEGDDTPHIISDWPDDIKYLCEELIVEPGKMIHVARMSFEVARVDAWPNTIPGAIQHNAYWDALALKELVTRTTCNDHAN